jgi:hypothetical protein
MQTIVTAENFLLISAQHYDDLGATDQEFKEDLRRFLLIKRLFNQYRKTGELKERLILNHIIIILNVFGDKAVELLFFELREYLSQLTVFLILLNRLPLKVGDVVVSNITLDQRVVSCLRETTKT